MFNMLYQVNQEGESKNKNKNEYGGKNRFMSEIKDRSKTGEHKVDPDLEELFYSQRHEGHHFLVIYKIHFTDHAMTARQQKTQ